MRKITDSASDIIWAEKQIEIVSPTKSAIQHFDASEDGARYLRITGMTMWENMGGDTLPNGGSDPRHDADKMYPVYDECDSPLGIVH